LGSREEEESEAGRKVWAAGRKSKRKRLTEKLAGREERKKRLTEKLVSLFK